MRGGRVRRLQARATTEAAALPAGSGEPLQGNVHLSERLLHPLTYDSKPRQADLCSLRRHLRRVLAVAALVIAKELARCRADVERVARRHAFFFADRKQCGRQAEGMEVGGVQACEVESAQPQLAEARVELEVTEAVRAAQLWSKAVAEAAYMSAVAGHGDATSLRGVGLACRSIESRREQVRQCVDEARDGRKRPGRDGGVQLGRRGPIGRRTTLPHAKDELHSRERPRQLHVTGQRCLAVA